MVRLALLATAGLATAFVSKSGPAPAVVRAPAQTAMQMKLYDWKRREAAEEASVGATEFRVDNIKPAPGATKRKIRKGRGISAGQGATAKNLLMTLRHLGRLKEFKHARGQRCFLLL